MQRSPPKSDLHVPRSTAIFAIFVGSGWMKPRDAKTPESTVQGCHKHIYIFNLHRLQYIKKRQFIEEDFF